MMKLIGPFTQFWFCHYVVSELYDFGNKRKQLPYPCIYNLIEIVELQLLKKGERDAETSLKVEIVIFGWTVSLNIYGWISLSLAVPLDNTLCRTLLWLLHLPLVMLIHNFFLL